MVLPRFNILLIDNDLDDLKALEGFLTAKNRHIFKSYSGEEGMKMLEKENIHLVITDQVQPDMDGFEFIEMLESNPATRNVFALLITRMDDQLNENIAYSLTHGAVDYLIKPVPRLIAQAKVQVFEKLYFKRLDLEEKNRKIQELLRNILPESTAEEMTKLGKPKVRSYASASVLFSDFVGFSHKAKNMDAIDLVKQLDYYFISFDKIISKYPIEKIKTIGDAYMCASGLPIHNRRHAIDMTLAALEMKTFMEKEADMKITIGEDPWRIRFGIHTGELVAGVVGMKKWSYDIWGHTVNTAKRLENAAEQGMVNISHSTYREIETYFICEYRGKVEAKHIGEIDMYNVIGLKPEYTDIPTSYHPNECFQKILAAL